MEVSSHALAMHRVDAVHFHAAAFTNLTADHLDFHGDMASYGKAKALLFTQLAPRYAVINVDDPFGAGLARGYKGALLRCSARVGVGADIRPLQVTLERKGITAQIVTPEGTALLKSPLLGQHNLENLLVALGCSLSCGVELGKALCGLAEAPSAPGRLEP